jgi:DNA-binding protein HU-beta
MPKNRQDLIDHVVSHGFTTRDAENAVTATLAGISTLSASDRLTLRGFGSFETRTRAARPGRNPRTGEALAIQARSFLAFRAAKSGS